MGSDARVSLTWGDGEERKYHLDYGLIEELQEKTARDGKPSGPLLLYQALTSGAWLVGDVYHTIRCGLLGGGMEPAGVRKLLDRYFGRRPLDDVTAAAEILKGWLEGAKDDPLPKSKAAETTTETTTAPAVSDSAASTKSAVPSESHPQKSESSHHTSSRARSQAGTNVTARAKRRPKNQ